LTQRTGLSREDILARSPDEKLLGSRRVSDALLREAGLGSTSQLLLLRRGVAGCLRVPLTFGHEALLGSAREFLLVCLGFAGCGALSRGAERGKRQDRGEDEGSHSDLQRLTSTAQP